MIRKHRAARCRSTSMCDPSTAATAWSCGASGSPWTADGGSFTSGASHPKSPLSRRSSYASTGKSRMTSSAFLRAVLADLPARPELVRHPFDLRRSVDEVEWHCAYPISSRSPSNPSDRPPCRSVTPDARRSSA